MQGKLEELISVIYKKWKGSQGAGQEVHPQDEEFACFIEGKLSPEEQTRIKEHLIRCSRCAEAVAVQIKLREGEAQEVPSELLSWTKKLIRSNDSSLFLEVLLKLKGKVLEIINTNGDILVGQELVPAAILRSRQKKDFKDGLTILKDFADLRVEIKIESKANNMFNIIIIVIEKQTQKVIRDLRVTLVKDDDDIELESYLTDAGSVIFESISFGKYIVKISSIDRKVASILLDLMV
ncbi:MAG: zf-HC2 domain-containing protein [Candidatus Omnitrophota bacterium]